MKRLLIAAASGTLFGFGLVLAGMTSPQKIVGFLDLFGRWDPSLALVMAGALAVTGIAVPAIVARGRPLFDVQLHVPTRRDIDVPLLAGSVVFGIGWGIAGYCPGPAIASLGLPVADAAWFVAAMIAGMLAKVWIFDRLFAPRSNPQTSSPD